MNPIVIKFGGYQKPASINNAAVQPVLLKYRRELDPQLFIWIEPSS